MDIAGVSSHRIPSPYLKNKKFNKLSRPTALLDACLLKGDRNA